MEMELPKYLINEIRTGSQELEGQDIELDDLDQAYEKDLDIEQYQQDDQETA